MHAEYVTTLMTRSSVKQIKPTCSSFQNPDSPPYRTAYPFRHHSGAGQSVSPLDSSEFVKKEFQHTGPTIAEKSRSPTYAQYYAIIN